MGKKKAKLKVREGSRLKLKEGLFARVERTPKPHETTLKVKKYIPDYTGRLVIPTFVTIPFGHIESVERF